MEPTEEALTANSPAPPPKPFNPDPFNPIWSEKAKELVDAGKLHVAIPNVFSVKVAVAEGDCPYCGDYMRDVQTLTAVGEGSDGPASRGVATRSAETIQALIINYEPVIFTCGCGVVHPGGEQGTHGCGTRFRLKAPIL